MRAIAEQRPDLRWIVIAAEPITDVDTTASDMLEELDVWLNERGVSLVFAEMKDPVREKIERYELTRTIDPAHFFPTVDDAVAEYVRQTGATWQSPGVARDHSSRGQQAQPVAPGRGGGCAGGSGRGLGLPGSVGDLTLGRSAGQRGLARSRRGRRVVHPVPTRGSPCRCCRRRGARAARIRRGGDRQREPYRARGRAGARRGLGRRGQLRAEPGRASQQPSSARQQAQSPGAA